MEKLDPYVIVDGVEIADVQRKVNGLIAQGYVPQPMAIAPSMPGAQSRPRYIVPMTLSERPEFYLRE